MHQKILLSLCLHYAVAVPGVTRNLDPAAACSPGSDQSCDATPSDRALASLTLLQLQHKRIKVPPPLVADESSEGLELTQHSGILEAATPSASRIAQMSQAILPSNAQVDQSKKEGSAEYVMSAAQVQVTIVESGASSESSLALLGKDVLVMTNQVRSVSHVIFIVAYCVLALMLVNWVAEQVFGAHPCECKWCLTMFLMMLFLPIMLIIAIVCYCRRPKA